MKEHDPRGVRHEVSTALVATLGTTRHDKLARVWGRGETVSTRMLNQHRQRGTHRHTTWKPCVAPPMTLDRACVTAAYISENKAPAAQLNGAGAVSALLGRLDLK